MLKCEFKIKTFSLILNKVDSFNVTHRGNDYICHWKSAQGRSTNLDWENEILGRNRQPNLFEGWGAINLENIKTINKWVKEKIIKNY